jgi:Leucine-rich repeat (LRR) protein
VLDELDVNNNSALEELYLNYNKLTKLEIENLAELKKLEFNYNLVSEVTVWGCFQLDWIYAKFNLLLSDQLEDLLLSMPDRTGLAKGLLFIEGNEYIFSPITTSKNWNVFQ